MTFERKGWIHLAVLVVTASSILTAGCLDEGEGESVGVSAFSLFVTADTEKNDHGGNLELVVVTAMEPTSKGNSLSWKFAYNEAASGTTTGSFLITIDHGGEVTRAEGDPLQKSPIRNWSLDSTSAYTKARDRLIEDGVISETTKVSVQFLYLLGDDENNNGCEWTVGMVLGSDQPLEVTVNVDGNSGQILELISSKGQ